MPKWYLEDNQPSWDFFLRRLAQAITAQFKKWIGRASFLFALLGTGCTPQLILQMTPVTPERVQWEQTITNAVNTHEARLERIEKGDTP